MSRSSFSPSQVKGGYRVKHWPAYNAGLVSRESLTVWLNPVVLGEKPAQARGRGRPQQYTDQVIQALLTLKQVYRLPLHALMGLAQRLKEVVWPNVPVPPYSTLSRRAQRLEVILPRLDGAGPLHLVVDSTGIKLYKKASERCVSRGIEAAQLA